MSRIDDIKATLAERKIVYFGTRGIDAVPLLDQLPVALVATQTADIPDTAGPAHICFENQTGIRRDLDRYNFDADTSPEAEELRTQVRAHLTPDHVVVTYRPAALLDGEHDRTNGALIASNTSELAKKLNDKIWVKQQLLQTDLRDVLIPSVEMNANQIQGAALFPDSAQLVASRPYGAGGVSVFKLDRDKPELPPGLGGDEPVMVMPLIENVRPLNVNCCVYKNGKTAVFGASSQLIGVPELTDLPFGFCGNDFGAATGYPEEVYDEAQKIAEKVGQFLHRLGYTGVFGIDFLTKDNSVICEINPRFQASTPLNSHIMKHLGLPDPHSEHVAAFLGMESPELPKLSDIMTLVADNIGNMPVAQTIHRNLGSDAIVMGNATLAARDSQSSLEGVAAPGTTIDPNALVTRQIHSHSVSEDGYMLNPYGKRRMLDAPVGSSATPQNKLKLD